MTRLSLGDYCCVPILYGLAYGSLAWYARTRSTRQSRLKSIVVYVVYEVLRILHKMHTGIYHGLGTSIHTAVLLCTLQQVLLYLQRWVPRPYDGPRVHMMDPVSASAAAVVAHTAVRM